MLRFLRMVARRAPLLAAILLIWLILTILSLAGRTGAYRNYSTEGLRLPGLSLVMRGIHDRVMPWSEAPVGADKKAGKDPGKGALAAGAGDTGPVPEAADEEDGDPAGGSGTDARDQEASGDQATGTGTEGAGQNDGAADRTGEDGSGAGAEKAAEKDVEKDADPAAAPGSQTLQIPESSCSRVAPAKDYGVAERGYLSPDDTVYNTDREGLFAPNGVYYSLQEVDDTYFSDALFVGDSRTVGLCDYGEMGDVTSFLARESTTIYDLFDDNEKMEYRPRGKEGSERTLKELLKKAKFRKIYLSVGVNELGVPDTEDYYREFRKVIEKINKLQPQALIYIQGIMHVSRTMSSTDPVYNNTAIVQRNQAIATLANGRSIFYIDMNKELCDENGDLKDELTGDGIHLKASAYDLWHSFLKKNAIVVPD